MSPARLLDLTRSLRRAGRVATGVDRVEQAYLAQFVQSDVPAFGLMRTAFGYILLDKNGMADFAASLSGARPWGPADLTSRLPRGRNQALIQAEADMRRGAIARCLPGRLRHMLTRHLTPGFTYYNTGHSNLTDRVLRSVGYAAGRVEVLVHDVIPLEHPDYQRPGTIRPFKEKMQRVSLLADRVIYNSEDTRQRTEAVMQDWGRVPPSIVAHLGTMIPVPDPKALPPGLPPKRPYFVTVGTIEPRKNHAFLLDLWDIMGPDAPPLLICGSRGWNNDAVFSRLDACDENSPVIELGGLSDGAIAALVQGSAGTLFPTHSEGFGLPPVEALTLGARVLCNDLPVLREILEGKPTFAPVFERKKWLDIIENWEKTPPKANQGSLYEGPKWAEHFNTVLGL